MNTPPESPDGLAQAYAAQAQAAEAELDRDLLTARARYEDALVGLFHQRGPLHEDTRACLARLVNLLGNLPGRDPNPLNEQNTHSASLYLCLHALQLGLPDAADRLARAVQQIERQRSPAPRTPEQQRQIDLALQRERESDHAAQAGDYAAAEVAMAEALALQEQVSGDTHGDLVPLLRKQIALSEAQGRGSAVLPLLRRIAAIYRATLGEHHLQTLQALQAVTMREISEYGLAGAGSARDLLQSMGQISGQSGVADHMLKMFASMLPKAGAQPSGPSRSERREQATQRSRAAQQPAALAGLADVDWASLHHAYGPATDVPQWLAMLLSSDARTRRDAWEEIGGALTHQGDLCTAVAAVVPFLLRMLADPATPDRGKILGFLAFLAHESLLPHQGSYGVATHAALLGGIATLLQVAEREPDMRGGAVLALGCFPERGDEIAPRLRALLPATPQPGIQAAILMALADLLPHTAPAQELFAPHLASTSATVRTAAAAALIDHMGQRAPAEAERAVLEALDGVVAALSPAPKVDMDALVAEHGIMALATAARMAMAGRLPYWDDEHRIGDFWLEDGITAMLAALGKLGAARAIPQLIPRLPTLPDTESAAGLMLSLAFGSPWQRSAGTSIHCDGGLPFTHDLPYGASVPAPDPAALSDAQRQALAALLDYEQIWEEQDQGVQMLRSYGLPASRSLLRLFLAGAAGADSPRAAPLVAVPAIAGVGPDAPPAIDRERRVGLLDAAMRSLGVPQEIHSAALAYLGGTEDYLSLKSKSNYFAIARFDREQFPIHISDAPHLDALDLQWLDVCVALGVVGGYIDMIADEDRVFQAMAHVRYQVSLDHYYFYSDYPAMAGIPSATAPLVRQGRPTALGRYILADLPESVYALVRVQRKMRTPLIELLLAADPPQIAEAMELESYKL